MIKLKLVNDYKEFVVKSAGKLRAFRAAAWPILFLTALSCSKTSVTPTCLDGDCNAKIIFAEQIDKNGYYHVKLDWQQEYYPYFDVHIEADITSPEYHYNGDPVVTAQFDSDTAWVIGDTLVMKQAYYKPFSGEWTSTGGPLPTHWKNLDLTQFSGTVVNIAQNTHIYFKQKGDKVISKRILGPFAPHLKGDTITIYMEVMWDAGDKSVIKSSFSEKFIVK